MGVVTLTLHAAMIYNGVEFPSSADLLMQGNWPIYQKQQKTELQSHRCIKNESVEPEKERMRARGEWVSTNRSSTQSNSSTSSSWEIYLCAILSIDNSLMSVQYEDKTSNQLV